MPEPEGSGLERIERMVVLVLENRSFDHVLGYLHASPGEAHAMTDLQHMMLAVDQAARDEGNPAGQP
jgi:phospholipase C